MAKFTPLQIPNTQNKKKIKKKSAKFFIPLTGEPPPSLNAIWKTLHSVSKVNVMKKSEKGHGKNKCDVINIGKYDTIG